MSFFDVLILGIILILFPIICVFIAKAYIKNTCNIDKDFLIDVANFSSFFLLLKYCDFSSPYSVLLINMPFVISVIHNRKAAGIILAIILMVFNGYLGFNIIFVISEYLIYIVLFLLLYKKGVSSCLILNTFIFIKGVFLTIYNYYILGNNNIFSLLEVFICLIVFYLIGVIIISIIDITNKTVSLNQTLKELEKEKDLKNSLFKITHEVKNPIAVCKGYLSMMDYNDINKVKRYNEIILSELNRTLDIMDNFSEYTKIKVNLDLMDLDYLISDTVDGLKMLFASNNIKVNYNSCDEVFINGDYSRLKQVLINVLKNSVEAISDSGMIDISLKTNKKYAVISIRDNGCGMTNEELTKIDQLFYSSKQKGCGIGVSLSKEIINLHNGTIKYKSVPNEYTEVIIRLPIVNSLHCNV